MGRFACFKLMISQVGVFILTCDSKCNMQNLELIQASIKLLRHWSDMKFLACHCGWPVCFNFVLCCQLDLATPNPAITYYTNISKKTKTCYNSFNAIVYKNANRLNSNIGSAFQLGFIHWVYECRTGSVKLLSTLLFTLPNSTFIHSDQKALILSVKVQFIISESQILHPFATLQGWVSSFYMYKH